MCLAPPNKMISGLPIMVWDLDPKTLPVIQVTPHYKERKFVLVKKIDYKVDDKSENIVNFVTGSSWTLMSVSVVSTVNNGSSCI